MQRMLSLVDPTRTGYEKLLGKGVWIFCTEVSRCMTGNLDFLNQVKNINPVLAELPDGML